MCLDGDTWDDNGFMAEWVLVFSAVPGLSIFTHARAHTKEREKYWSKIVKFLGINYLATPLSDHFVHPAHPGPSILQGFCTLDRRANSCVPTLPMLEGSNSQRTADGVQASAHFSLSGCWSHPHPELHSFINSPVIHTVCSFQGRIN